MVIKYILDPFLQIAIYLEYNASKFKNELSNKKTIIYLYVQLICEFDRVYLISWKLFNNYHRF